MTYSLPVQSIKEEIANSLTHGLGLVLSAGGVVLLVTLAVLHGEARHIVSCAIYGTSLVFLYGASTLYHSMRNPTARHVFKVIDHSAIYLLIAGTYTPFSLVSLRGPWGWSLFGVVWGLAVLGIIFKVTMLRRCRDQTS